MTAQTRNELIKLAILASTVGFGFLLAQTALPATATPGHVTQEQLDIALANAREQWGVRPEDPVDAKLEIASACGVIKSEDRDKLPHTGYEADLSRAAAITNKIQYKTRWIVDAEPDKDTVNVTSKIMFDGGTSTVFDKTTEISNSPEDPSPEETTYEWVIRINAACNFWTQSVLNQFVLHEYGHTLGLDHSKNERSIMYWVVFLPAAEKKFGAQSITDADRKRVRVEVSAAAAR